MHRRHRLAHLILTIVVALGLILPRARAKNLVSVARFLNMRI